MSCKLNARVQYISKWSTHPVEIIYNPEAGQLWLSTSCSSLET